MTESSARGRRLLATAVAGLVFAGTIGALAPPASAAYTDCPSARACLWWNNAYPGSPQASFLNYTGALTASNNQANSVANNGNSNVAYFWDSTTCSNSPAIPMNNPARGGQTRDPDLTNGTIHTTDNWADRIGCGSFF